MQTPDSQFFSGDRLQTNSVLKSAFYFYFFLATAAVLTARGEIVVRSEIEPVTDLAPHLSLMVDPGARLDIHEVLAGEGSGFVPNTRAVPSFGFTRSAIWMKVQIRSEYDREAEYVAALAAARLSHFSWYAVMNGRVVQTATCGSAEGGGKGFYRLPRINLEIPPGAAVTLYARSQSDTSQWLEMTGGSPGTMNRYLVGKSASDLILAGFIGATSLLALLFGMIHRNSFYLYNSALSFIYFFYYLIFNGYLRLMWPQMPQWFERGGFGILCVAGLLVLTRFNRVFFKISDAKRRALVAQRIAEGLSLLGIGLFLVLDFYYAIQLLTPLQILIIIAGSTAIFFHAHTTSRPEKIGFLITWGGYAVLVIFFGLQISDAIRFLIPANLFQQLMMPVILSGFLLAVLARERKLNELEIDLANAMRAESDAYLCALRYQINPHFLYNTLASIDALSRIAPASVPTLVSRLSTFLRLRLAPSTNHLNSFERELESIRAYLDIERTRFGNALTTAYDIDPAALSWQIPELLLQPLVENAVKYGFEAGTDLDIMIHARIKRDMLFILISNSGSLYSAGDTVVRRGIGSSNVRLRLAIHYGSRAVFRLTQEGKNVVAQLVIPAHRNP